LELFEKSPPIEPAATISSMGEVPAAVQPDVDLAPPPEEPAPQAQPATEQVVPAESIVESTPAAVEPMQPGTPAADVVSTEAAPEPEAEQSAATKSPMDLLAKLLRGESARPDES
jgi:hypothetical protein